MKAVELIPYGSKEHLDFMKAIRRCYPEAKYFQHSWMVKSLAAILQPDRTGNRITPLLIIMTEKGLRHKSKNYLH